MNPKMFLLEVPVPFKGVTFCVNIVFQKFLNLLDAVALPELLSKERNDNDKKFSKFNKSNYCHLKLPNTKACQLFRQSYKNNVFCDRYDKKCFKSINCYAYATRYLYVKSSQHERFALSNQSIGKV